MTGGGRGGRILVVDDNPVNRRVATLLLEKAGYRVDAVADGREAVDAVGAGRYDAVLMDCEMPVMDGYQAVAEIRRREPPGTRVPIVAVTASAMKEDVERAIAAGMDAHVAKPIDRVQLIDVLAGLVERRPEAVGADEPPARAAGAGALDADVIADLRRIDGTGQGLRSLIDLFVEDGPALVARVREGVRVHDDHAAGLAAHNLRGSASIFGAVGLADLAGRIDDDIRAGRPPSPESIAALEKAVGPVIAALEAVRDDASGRK